MRALLCKIGWHHPDTRRLMRKGPPMRPGWQLQCLSCGRRVR